MKHMAYTNNPNIERVRYEAYRLVHYQGWSSRRAARHLGYAHNTLARWVKEKPCYNSRGQMVIPTESSKPRHHPRELSQETVACVLEMRSERQQCAEILYHRLQEKGVNASLSSVKRVLKRYGCSRYSKWKKWHQYPSRPLPSEPGLLVEIDSVIEGVPQERLCAYAFVDLFSRWGNVLPIASPNSRLSVEFVKKTIRIAPFKVQTLQTDHGNEFSKWFTKVIESQGVKHRHSRVRRPTDNGHVERFIRSLQDECLHRIPRKQSVWQKKIPEWLHYYNNERPHMGLNMKTPMEVVRSY